MAALAVFPFLGRSFLPPFNEGSLTVGLVSPLGTPLSEGDAAGRQVEEALLAFPEVVSTSRRTGRAEKDEHVQGVNASEMEVVLREGRPKAELLAAMRRAVAAIPGVAVTFGQPISHRIDHMISGSKTNLAVKVFGPDLAVLRGLAAEAEGRLRGVSGIVDLSNQEQQSVPQLLVDFDRAAMGRYGLSPARLSQSLEALFQGTEAGEIVEGGLASRVVVRLPERLRADRDALDALPVTTAEGRVVRLGEVARVRFDLGPGLVRRENVQRLALLTANVAGADLTGTVDRARASLEGLALPTGYQVTFGGQFEEAARSQQNLGFLAVLAFVGMYGLLLLAFRDHRHVAIVLVNLPLALIGGLAAILLHGGVLSVASIVGFVTLFGIATRNGVLLVSHYQHLMRDEGLPLLEAVRLGSRERLAPVLMTALTAGARPRAARPRRGPPGQRDPEPDGRGDPGRAALLDLPQPRRRAGALRAVGRGARLSRSREREDHPVAAVGVVPAAGHHAPAHVSCFRSADRAPGVGESRAQVASRRGVAGRGRGR